MRRTRLRHTKKYWPTPHYQAQLVTSGQNGFFFRDALHLAHPARSSTFFSEKKNEKRHFAMVQPTAKFIRDEISVLSIYQFPPQNIHTIQIGRFFFRPRFPGAQY